MHRRALEGFEQALGKEHQSTLAITNNLPEVLQGQGKYETAEDRHRQVLERQKNVLGKEHPDTLKGMDNLAIVLG